MDQFAREDAVEIKCVQPWLQMIGPTITITMAQLVRA
jgi:hypothetical protein